MRYTNDFINNNNRVFFVPTFGFSASDNFLISEKNYPDPYFAIGRLAARTPDDIKNYLDKIKQYDLAPISSATIEDQYWMKRVLHLGGGADDSQQTQIRLGLDIFGQYLKDTIYGADISTFSKQSSQTIEFIVNEQINFIFNDGVSLVNFFGHSAPGAWDFALDNPRNFKNFGKYPFINSFGCYSGNLHGLAKGISESFVLEKDKGAIAFFASTGTATIPSLTQYGRNFFDLLLNEYRYKTYGETIKKLATDNRNSTSSQLALYSQLTLHGDPAIKPYIDLASDYVFDEKSVKTIPSSIQTSLKNYSLELDITNIGAYQKDSFDITFYHSQPNGLHVDTIIIKNEGVANKKTIQVPLKNYDDISVGKHKITAFIDLSNKITEFPLPEGESNNELVINNQNGYEYFVTDNAAVAIYPPDFAMINTKDHYILKASTSVAPVVKGDFVFQIDTTAYFNSSIKETGKVISEGGLITYQPNLPLVANRVYYWRVSPDSISSIEGYKWSQASFAYLPNEEEGWNQSHFFQFSINNQNEMEITEETGRKFDFGKEYNTIKVRNKVWNIDDKPGYLYNNVRFESVTPWNYMDAGIGFVINDRNNLLPGLWNPAGGIFGSNNPTGNRVRGFFFNTQTLEERKNIIEFLESELKDGYYINAFTILKNSNSNLNAEEWASDSLVLGKNLFNVFESLGATRLRELINNSVPYIFQGEKGKGAANELVGNTIDDIIESTFIVNRKSTTGNFESFSINKVQTWNYIKYGRQELQEEEIFKLDILGIDENNTESVFGESVLNDQQYSLENFNFPSLKLKTFNKDSLNRTSPQLNFWRVSFSPLPDIAITYIKTEPNEISDNLNQGENLKFHYEVANVNYTAMDSILVKYTMTTSSNQSITTFKKLKPLQSGEKLNDVAEFAVGSGNFSEIRFFIEVNPDQTPKELHTFNNVISKQYNVAKDKDNPLLDVYFDGIKIMDGDIVSPKPEILVTLEDDNSFLPITDPELFEIKLDTGRNQFLEIPMSSPQIKFTPADQNNTTAKVHYYPILKDGEYKLIVQGKDASGNKSGINPRSISFNVIEKQSISNVLNYPNPFSTSTQFVFTLTGEEVPDIMSISIMTLTGKVVKEITKDELGPLRIGINRTEYKWDGTDDFGSKLANGVYLYKINSRKQNGEKYDQFTVNKIDNLFKNGFGKMVILR